LTKNTTKEQVKEQFKLVTGLTAIEDIFVGLKQAEERQILKDKIDSLFSEYNQYDFYEALELDNVYSAIISILTDPKLKINFLTNTTPNIIQNYYKNNEVSLTLSEGNNNSYLIVHELVHAYNDMRLGGFSYEKDEAIATIIGNIFVGDIKRSLVRWETVLNKPNVTEAELTDAWNNLWYKKHDLYGDCLPKQLLNMDVTYSYWFWQNDAYSRKSNINDLINIKKFFKVYFSQDAIKEYSTPKLPQGYTLPIVNPPFESGY
jgi:hypothetical protein